MLPPLWPPTPNQRLLLTAALLPDAKALAAWRAWRAQVDIEETHLDSGSYHLLPLVWRNLHALAEDDLLMGRLRGIRRRTWYANQRLLAAVGQAVTGLAQVGIDVLLLDGAAIIAVYDQDLGAHMLNSATLLVRPAQAARSLQMLADAGWRPLYRGWRAADSDLAPACRLVDGEGQRLRVQWHLVGHDRRRAADDAVWEDAQAAVMAGWTVRVPSAADLVLSLAGNLPVDAPFAVLPHLAGLWLVLNRAYGTLNEKALADASRLRRVEKLVAMTREYVGGLHSEQVTPMPAGDALCAALARPATRLNRLRLRWLMLRLSEASAGRGGLLRAALRFPRYMQLAASA